MAKVSKITTTAVIIFIHLLVWGSPLINCWAEEDEPIEPVILTLKINMGDIVLELDKENAPITVENFLKYYDDGFYDLTIFHRVIDGFVIQGGGYDRRLRPKETRPPIKNEADNGLLNEAYTIAMYRKADDPHSATSQFYINLADNPSLDKNNLGEGYTVFGRVIQGKEVVDSIGRVKTTSVGNHQHVPVKTVIIDYYRDDKDDACFIQAVQ